jgi:hypothetical protein
MRVVGAGCFIFVGILALLAVVGPWMDHPGPVTSILGLPVMLFGIVVLTIFAFFFFNDPLFFFRRRSTVGSKEEYAEERRKEVAELKVQGLLVSTNYKANRAFLISCFEDEGDCIFIELENRSVLVLQGQYLDDYHHVDGIDEDQVFPCTDFTIHSHRDGYPVDIEMRGAVIAYEEDLDHTALGGLTPWIIDKRGTRKRDWDKLAQDGDIITDRSFDELLAAAKEAEVEETP